MAESWFRLSPEDQAEALQRGTSAKLLRLRQQIMLEKCHNMAR